MKEFDVLYGDDSIRLVLRNSNSLRLFEKVRDDFGQIYWRPTVTFDNKGLVNSVIALFNKTIELEKKRK